MITRTRFISLVILALSLGGYAQASYVREIEETFTVSEGGQLTINTSGGDVTVVTGAVDKVRVEARQVFHAADNADEAEEEAKNLEFSITQNGDDVSAISKYKRTSSKWFSWGRRGVSVSFTVTVPPHYHVKASTSGGDVEVADIAGRVEVRTSGGDIELGRIEGEIDAVTSGGDIDVEAGRGNIKVVTSGGDIRVERAVGDVRASTSGGDVRIEYVDGVVDASSSGGNVVARFASELTGAASLSTSGGNVTAWLPESAGADLNASTSGGSVKTDGLRVEVHHGGQGKNKLVGEINGGGERLRLRTSGGNIRVKVGSFDS